ncbi:MAG: hypothetical protein ABIO44_07095, partial [Saprospiraceae bacterium]
MTKLFLIFSFALSINALSQAIDKTVTLTVSGLGKTQDEAKQAALRNAIEQAFGTFISSKTEILNDDLIKDEIVSVSNGSIQKFNVISEVQMPDGSFATILIATVSVNKLTSFIESKEMNIEFKGALFAFNLNQQILNEKNEIKAMNDLSYVIKKIADNAFDYKLTVTEPISINGDNTQWKIPMQISISSNKNFN